MTTFARGGTACQEVVFREFPGGPLVDPDDARFDVLDPDGVTLTSNQPTMILSPGLHEGCWPIPEAAALGDYVMRFKATINGAAVTKDCSFTVVAAGSIESAPSHGVTGPCEPWPIDETCPSAVEELDPAVVEQARSVSTTILWAASGRRHGLCPVTIRPCLRRCLTTSGSGFASYPVRSDGGWLNVSVCGCTSDCSCTQLCEIALEGPVDSVTEILIDGVEVPESAWRLDGNLLLRTDGDCWPTCQDMTADCDEEGAFCVTYLAGVPLDTAAVLAHSTLTFELAKSCTPGCKCRLPANATSKTQQGVTITLDPRDLIGALPEVSMWLEAVNPARLHSEPAIFSPDLPSYRRM